MLPVGVLKLDTLRAFMAQRKCKFNVKKKFPDSALELVLSRG